MAHKPNDHHGKTEHEKAESKFSGLGKDNDHHRHTEKERTESEFSDSDTDGMTTTCILSAKEPQSSQTILIAT